MIQQFGSRRKLIDTTKNGEKVVDVLLLQQNLVDNQYQQNSEVLLTFTSKKSYAYLLNGQLNNLVIQKLIFSLMKLS